MFLIPPFSKSPEVFFFFFVEYIDRLQREKLGESHLYFGIHFCTKNKHFFETKTG